MKKLLLLIACILLGMTVQAGPVSEQEALQKAQAFMKEKFEATGSSHRAPRKMQRVSKATENDAFYIFNAEDNGGFVIISGDERLPAVLGYSLTGCYDPENVPANMQSWLNCYVEQVKYVQTHDGTMLSQRRSVTGPDISPLLNCEWDQYAPYNGNCPVVFDVQSPVGCVATAMAQIMYYYQWPQQTRKVVPGYSIYDNGVTISDIPVTTIDWDNILPKYDYDGSYSAEQVDAIAQLMQLCGTSVRMRYDASESSATMTRVMKSFPRYFGYSTDISLAFAADYESDAWEQLIYDELTASRPIMYSGSGESGGHTFIVDGYDDNDYFHINWGWGGSDNGYFLLSVLPNYNINQCAVIGLQPSTTSIPDAYGVLEDGTMTLYYDTKMNERSGQVFDNLVSDAYFGFMPLDLEILCCPAEESMTQCVIDPSFANYDLETLYRFFSQCENLKTITGLKYLNTSHVTDMSDMFIKCSSLESVDLNGLSTVHVQNMGSMFRYCAALKSLDMSCLNTENVNNMSEMFNECRSLEQIDFSNLNAEKVELMLEMFRDCPSLKSLDLSSFHTKSLLSMYGMFEGCSSLTDLDISNFQTDNVIDMAYTFRYCSSLKSLDLSHFNTQNVEQTDNMFEGCTALEDIDLSSFNTENVETMCDMFRECTSLKTLDMSTFNTSKVNNMWGMFVNCSSLESINLSSFNTEKVINMEAMFYGCNSLKTLDLSSFNTSNVTNMKLMFNACCSLESLDLSSFNTENVTTMYAMFEYCPLKVLDLSSFNTSKVTNIDRLLSQNMDLETVYVGDGWNTDNVEAGEPFYGCEKLVGGKGTTFDWDHIGVDYARVDGGPDNPGYLSLKKENTLILGDGTGDGVVDISDYIGVANYILGIPQTGFDADAADVNMDGIIDISDYIGVANIILTGKP